LAKEAMAIKYGSTTGHSIKKFLELPFAGKHPKLISKGPKTAAAEAAVTAAEAIAVADLEEANRIIADFEALGGGALTMALAQEAEPAPPPAAAAAPAAVAAFTAAAASAAAASAVVTSAASAVASVRAVKISARLIKRASDTWSRSCASKLSRKGSPQKPPPMRLARERPWRPSCRKSLAAARTVWPWTPRRSPGGPYFMWGPERN
jgi:hypothetical protein